MIIAVMAGAVCSLLPARPSMAETRPGYTRGPLTGSLLSEPTTFDPLGAHSHADATIVSLVFDTLYRVDGQGAVQPHLAAGPPDVSADGRTVTIPVRKGVAFHDRSKLTPEVVTRSLQRVVRRASWLLAPVTDVRAGTNAVVLTLRRRTPDLTTLLSATGTAITRNGNTPRAGRPIGTGPYRVAGFSRNRRRLTLVASKTHFAGVPYVTRLVLTWYALADREAARYEAGEVHLSLRGAVAYAGHVPKYQTEHVQGPATLLVYVGFGKTNARITGHRQFRHALSLALSRRAFQYIGTGERVTPAVHPVARDAGGPTPSATELSANLPAARAALARGPAIGSTSLELIVDRTRLDDKGIAQKISFAMSRVGVAVHITELSATDFAARVASGRTDLYIGQLVAPAPSPMLVTAAAFAAGGDRWLSARWAKVPLATAQVLAGFAKRLPVVPLFHRAVRMHHRKNIRGVGFDSLTMASFADMFVFGGSRRSTGRRGVP